MNDIRKVFDDMVDDFVKFIQKHNRECSCIGCIRRKNRDVKLNKTHGEITQHQTQTPQQAVVVTIKQNNATEPDGDWQMDMDA